MEEDFDKAKDVLMSILALLFWFAFIPGVIYFILIPALDLLSPVLEWFLSVFGVIIIWLIGFKLIGDSSGEDKPPKDKAGYPYEKERR